MLVGQVLHFDVVKDMGEETLSRRRVREERRIGDQSESRKESRNYGPVPAVLKDSPDSVKFRMHYIQ